MTYPPKLLPASWVKDQPTVHIDEDSLPQLVLFTEIQEVPNLLHPNKWNYIYHQTGGYACNHTLLYGQFLPLKKPYQEFFQTLTKNYVDSCIMSPPPFKAAEEYQKALSTVGLDANSSYHRLEEGFYPIDIEHIHKLSAKKLPTDLNTLEKRDKKKKFHFPTHWQCAILGRNCD